MDAIARAYLRLTSRTGKAEPFIHASALTYAVLLFIAALLNAFAPTWVSRNTPVLTPSISDDPLMRTDLTTNAQQFTHPTPVDDCAVSRCLSRGLLHDISHDPVVTRVRAEMDCGCRVPDVYESHENPNVCAVVQSFNHQDNVQMIAKSLVNNPAIQEIIICEDGSTDGSLDKWMEELRMQKHFIVISNNLHETRCYNRAMRMSSAEFFVLLQDDDMASDIETDSTGTDPPPTSNWVTHALALFDADPKLAILSGFIGQMWDPVKGNGFEFGEQASDHGGTRKGSTYRIPFLSSRTLNPFMYLECAWAAPLFVRAESLHRVGGLDVGLFNVGEPGVWHDCVLSYAAWTAGWRVGVYDASFQRGVGGHGSASSPEKIKLRGTVWKKAKDACDTRYDRAYIHQYVLTLNNQTLLSRVSNSSLQAATE